MVLNFFKSAFNKSGSLLGNKIRSLFSKKIDEETLEQLQKILYEADLGNKTALDLVEKVKVWYRSNASLTSDELLQKMCEEITSLLKAHSSSLQLAPNTEPTVILVVGVNGNGKTTSIAKLAHFYQSQGQKVLIAAADTFRAAAIEQLTLWAENLNVDIVKGQSGCDPAAVAFDAVTAGKARNADIILIDTAGRLHTKTSLMKELEKIKKVCGKVVERAPHETLLVLDATAGQNALEQAKTFNKFTPISGLILSKMDGTAKGGTVVSIQRELDIPVKFIGTGESHLDITSFDPDAFAAQLFE